MKKALLASFLLLMPFGALAQSEVQVDADGTVRVKTKDGEVVVGGDGRRGTVKTADGRLATSDAEHIKIHSNSESLVRTCSKGMKVTVHGNRNSVRLRGPCAEVHLAGNRNSLLAAQVKRVFLSGNKNDAEIHSVASIKVTGNKNALRYRRPISKKAKRPSIANTGAKNSITRLKD